MGSITPMQPCFPAPITETSLIVLSCLFPCSFPLHFAALRYECPVCSDDELPLDRLMFLDCSHYLCVDCMRHHLRSCIEGASTGSCGVLSSSRCQSLVPCYLPASVSCLYQAFIIFNLCFRLACVAASSLRRRALQGHQVPWPRVQAHDQLWSVSLASSPALSLCPTLCYWFLPRLFSL